MKYVKPERLTEQSLILDVRTPDEIREEALSLPFFNEELSKLNPRDFVYEHNLDGSKTLNIICHSGPILWTERMTVRYSAQSLSGNVLKISPGHFPTQETLTKSDFLKPAVIVNTTKNQEKNNVITRCPEFGEID